MLKTQLRLGVLWPRSEYGVGALPTHRAAARFRSSLMPNLRSIPFQHYVVFYVAEGDNVRIERVLHSARDIEAVFDEDGDV